MTAHIETKEALRTWIRALWLDINQRKLTPSKALDAIDSLHAEELKGACRGEILDILDKAATRVGGDKPEVTDREDGEAYIPSAVVGVSRPGDGEELPQRSSNIIQLPMRV